MARRIRFADDVVGGDVGGQVAVDNAPTPGGISLDRKKAKTDQFFEWRRGNYNWIEAERQAEINAVVHPKPGAWDPWDLTDPAAGSELEQLIASSRQRYRNNADADQAANAGALDEDPAVAASRTAATITLHERFQAVGFGKVTRLGSGGRHATFCFGMEDSRRNVHNVVVKLDLTNESATRDELTILKVRLEPSEDTYIMKIDTFQLSKATERRTAHYATTAATSNARPRTRPRRTAASARRPHSTRRRSQTSSCTCNNSSSRHRSFAQPSPARRCKWLRYHHTRHTDPPSKAGAGRCGEHSCHGVYGKARPGVVAGETCP